jgi:hypothetical protein
MKPKVIKSEREYQAALVRIDRLMDAVPNTPQGDFIGPAAFGRNGRVANLMP